MWEEGMDWEGGVALDCVEESVKETISTCDMEIIDYGGKHLVDRKRTAVGVSIRSAIWRGFCHLELYCTIVPRQWYLL